VTDWCLTALSAPISYIVPSKSALQLKIEINEKVDNVMCWDCVGRAVKVYSLTHSA